MKDRVIKEKLKQETKQLQNNYQFKCLSSLYVYNFLSLSTIILLFLILRTIPIRRQIIIRTSQN